MSLALPESLRLLLPDGKIKNILLEDYLRGVVAAALPADAPLEAQKALAVAARTFAANTHRHTDRDADVCTLRHCQAWNERANPRASRAVLETRSIVATFDDKLIEAFYFDHCDGKTREAKGVLMDAPGYLKSVTCPCGFASMKGHGIGMCQRGMLSMARLGEAYNNILTHYYTGIALQEIGVDKTTKIQDPRPVTRRAAAAISGTAPSKPRTTAKPTPRVERTESKTETPPLAAAEGAPETLAPKPVTPRRSPRPKPEQQEAAQAQEPTPPLAQETTPETFTPLTVEPAATTAPPPPEAYVTLNDVHSAEEDDLFLFLAVEDVKPTVAPPPVRAVPLSGVRPPPVFDAPPPSSMPEEESAFEPQRFAPQPSTPPPPSMPEEDVPNESELDFLAPPMGAMPEEPIPGDILAPLASYIEPDLLEFMPPIERFYTPLDAPPTMPEAMPFFTNSGADETPIAWAPPPPMQESAWAMNQPRVLMDVLPGPRIIAGNLAKPGTLITIRDTRGNSIVTVSGVAKQYGHGGFEAPLTDDGAYQVKFNGTELNVSLENETVFIYYQ